MAVEEFQAHTPSLRYKTVSDFADVTQGKPSRSRKLHRRSCTGRADATTRARHALVRGGGHSGATASSTSAGTRTASRRRSRRSSTTRTARRASRCCTTWTARSATSWRRSASGRRHADVGRRRRDPRRATRCRSATIPLGTTIHNVELIPGKGGQVARGGRQRVPGHGEGRALRPGAAPVRRGAHVRPRLLLHHRQVGNLDHENIVIGKAGRNRWLGMAPARAAASR